MMLRSMLLGTALIVVGASVAAADGATVYKDQCAKCHGDTGKADTTIGKAMKVPPIAGDAKIEKMTATEVATAITGNQKHPPTVKALSADDIAAVATYVKGLAGGK